VRKLGKEFLVAASDIEWPAGLGQLREPACPGAHYPLRTTMSRIEPRLDSARFVRVHASYMVNLDLHLADRTLESGDGAS